jgi:hypothetical protein
VACKRNSDHGEINSSAAKSKHSQWGADKIGSRVEDNILKGNRSRVKGI